ncbi:hypothetical protein [Bifidobacterium tissieri]|uniref:hypothetical protein n=1 Tax=Bifidobacterium tissieri TaxID=1630162 RepID=UPI000B9A9954|nr:hypothetical protein [Bifidobacterium tissieri]
MWIRVDSVEAQWIRLLPHRQWKGAVVGLVSRFGVADPLCVGAADLLNQTLQVDSLREEEALLRVDIRIAMYPQ